MIPPFDQDVPNNGYAWWYLDAMSDDGRYGLTLIAFIGSVFSPYYAWDRARGKGNPLAHCAINVALYGRGGRWSMTERDGSAISREPDSLRVGPSGLHWNGESLEIELHEWAFPLPRRIRGRIRVDPVISNRAALHLDPDGHHQWTPVWPAARVSVDLGNPAIRWSGSAYFDHNAGDEPLEQCFNNWHWSRAATRTGPVVLYDTEQLDGRHGSHALHFAHDGRRRDLQRPPQVGLPKSRWGVARAARSEDGDARLKAVWEDTPFYARSLIATRLLGEQVTAVHESLSLPRFSAFWVQLMLPFRMPRKA
ncbi:MAG: carotenoid 1,2-hydratase [Wenzhouxiangella sp.]|jgi:carotenoid 1,2-hydratase|nr:carotenoid 1,2-hydratase [Wenzhouxiangella sp.]